MQITLPLIGVELITLGFITYVCRGWELRLLKGEPLPEGRISLYLRFLRPQGWIVFSTLFVFLAYPGFHPSFLFIFPAIFFQQGFLYAVNDYWDREVDSLNEMKKRRSVVASGELSLSECRLVLITLFSLGMIFSVLLGPFTGLLSMVFMVASYAYSAPPMRFKGRVYWDLVSHGFLVFSFPYLFTTVALKSYSLRNLVMYGIFVLLSLYIQVSQEARDFHEDTQMETNSTLAMGYKKAYLFMTLLLVTSLSLCILLVFSGRVSSFFLLAGSLCAFALNDLYAAYKKKDYGACFRNTWSHFNKKAIVGLGPVILWWLLHR